MTAAVRHSAEGAPEVIDPRPMNGPLVVTLICLIAGLGLSLWAFTDSLEGSRGIQLPRIEVPDVKSMGLDQAKGELERAGFVVEVQFQPNEDPLKPKGVIIGQKPLSGSKAEQGELVVIRVSDGPLGQSVPGVEGQQAIDAVATLQANGLIVEQIPTPSETVRANEVIATDPPSGARVPGSGRDQDPGLVGPGAATRPTDPRQAAGAGPRRHRPERPRGWQDQASVPSGPRAGNRVRGRPGRRLTVAA
ncbi:MAG: PASTA domain-containing protein [Microthrixaceae bacterium]